MWSTSPSGTAVSPSFIVLVDSPVKWPALSGTLTTRGGLDGPSSFGGSSVTSSVGVSSTGDSSTGVSVGVSWTGVSSTGVAVFVGSVALIQLLWLGLQAYHRLFCWIMNVPLGSAPFSFHLPGCG